MSATTKRLLLLAALIAAILAVILNRHRFDAAALQQWIESTGAIGPLAFIAIYALGTVLFLPGSILTLSGGALFGPLWGTLYNLLGATLGATLAFVIARHLASDWVSEKAGGRLKQLINGVEKEGWRFVAFTRLVPLFPFNLLNYALGLTRIRLRHYVIATFIFMIPGALAYTWLGYAGKEAITGGEGLIQKGLLALALLAMAAFIPRIVSMFRSGQSLTVEQLKERIDSGEDLLLLDVRTETDYNGPLAHIANSLNIPLEKLESQLNQLVAFQEKPVALVCTTDRRSARAARILAGQGFADVHIITGGMSAWNDHHFPLANRGREP